MSPANTQGPAGPTARYLTVGGATVDITKIAGHVNRPELTHTQAVCTGCDETHAVEWVIDGPWDDTIHAYRTSRDHDGQQATPRARRWAQDHASTCRAMPRPAVQAMGGDDFGDGPW